LPHQARAGSNSNLKRQSIKLDDMVLILEQFNFQFQYGQFQPRPSSIGCKHRARLSLRRDGSELDFVTWQNKAEQEVRTLKIFSRRRTKAGRGGPEAVQRQARGGPRRPRGGPMIAKEY
jgi:hypothetical protein